MYFTHFQQIRKKLIQTHISRTVLNLNVDKKHIFKKLLRLLVKHLFNLYGISLIFLTILNNYTKKNFIHKNVSLIRKHFLSFFGSFGSCRHRRKNSDLEVVRSFLFFLDPDPHLAKCVCVISISFPFRDMSCVCVGTCVRVCV